MRPLFVGIGSVLFVACGAATPTASEPIAVSAGGEEEEVRSYPLRTTTPIPVPLPAVPREELSDPLQHFWTEIEETVAIRPPDGPTEASAEAVQAWADGVFADWIRTRSEAMRGAITTSREVPEAPLYERAVAAALLGYALEDFVADVRGSPVPADIARDPELLRIYVDNLHEVLRPTASEAVLAYELCRRRLASLGDDSGWLAWRAYCIDRGREIIEVFELAPAEPEPSEQEPSQPQPSQPQPDEVPRS